jgi:hypothetical protein
MVTEIELPPLGRAEVASLVDAVAGGLAPRAPTGLDGDARERVIAAADGNPLLALESARAAARGDQGPPPSLRALVRAAVARLDEPARRAAELSAVARRDLARAELAALAEAARHLRLAGRDDLAAVLHVEIPEREAHLLDGQRDAVSACLRSLAALAEAATDASPARG